VPPMHRETLLRTVECADVPMLIVVWLGQHRNDAAPTVFVTPTTTKPKPSVAIAVDPPPNKIEAMDQRDWSPCTGPPPCGTFRGGLGLGASTDGAILNADTAWQFAGSFGLAVGANLTASQQGVFPAGFAGVLYSTHISDFEFGGIGALSVGQTNVTTSVVAPVNEQECPPPGTPPRTIDKNDTRLFVGPRLSMRARWAWGYVEGGAVWQLGADLTPKVFAIAGVQLFGI
jgi:hypothetical protein